MTFQSRINNISFWVCDISGAFLWSLSSKESLTSEFKNDRYKKCEAIDIIDYSIYYMKDSYRCQ